MPKKKLNTKYKILDTKLTWFPKKTFELEITIPKKDVQNSYKESLEELTKTTNIKGFRKGKAPVKLVEEKIGKEKIYQEVVNQLLPATYDQALSQHKLRPITAPKITPVKMASDNDWVIKAKSAEAPEVKLGDWEKAVKETKKESPKIWTPDSSAAAPASPAGGSAKADKPDKPDSVPPDKTESQKLNKILKALLKEATVEISGLVIEDEVNRMLSRLLDQVNKLGLTIDQYLSSNNKSQDSLRKEYRETAERTLKLEFILLKLAQEKNTKVSDEEIDKMIKAVPDEKARKNLQTPQQKTYIATIIRKRKTIDMLLNLA